MTKDEALKLTEILNHAIWDSVQVIIQPEPQQPKCNPHPKAPHGLVRGASYSAARYVCECELWDPYEAGREAGVQAMLDYDMPTTKPEPAPYNPLSTSEIVECAVKVWRFDANDVSANTIKFAREIERLTLDR
jgi:hypothetical protein